LSEAALPPAPTGPEGSVPSVARRLALYQRAGGFVTPLVTALLAFLMGGIVVGATGHNPLTTYRDIFRGTGLNWIGSFVRWLALSIGFQHPKFPGSTDAALNLQQTLIITTALILTGLAVAFAFRCGMFNIGGQGQYFVGQYVAVVVGSSWAGLAGPAHLFLAIVLAALAGAFWAGIAGFLKATVGAHEVISTIMLNWIAIWVGSWMFGLGGPLHSGAPQDAFNPVSSTIADNVHLPVFWGDPTAQGLDIGFFIAIGALVAYWILLNRTTVGYEVRAVGFNPEAARYGGISVRRNYILAMAISGTFAGLAGAIDMLGWQFQLATPTIFISANVGFIGIAVALLGRNTAIGTFLGAVVFGALYVGTSTRNLTSGFDPALASNLTLIIQGLVVLFIGADVLVLYVWNLRRRVRGRRATPTAIPEKAEA
jgi:simple sugar transport system permease protein